MRAILLALGALIVVALVLLWPPAVLHISITRRGVGWMAFISDVRAAILVFAVVTFIAAVVSAVISAARHHA
jgi:hypothetical protein